MRRLILGLVVIVAGCQGIDGPLAHRAKPEWINNPGLTIPEQEQRGRDRLALPEPSNDIAPRTYAEFPDYKGRIAQ
jgi:hypothetical protein